MDKEKFEESLSNLAIVLKHNDELKKKLLGLKLLPKNVRETELLKITQKMKEDKVDDEIINLFKKLSIQNVLESLVKIID